MESRWSDREAAEYLERYAPRWGEALALRVYTSRLIGRDPDLVMHGGGNTSLKGTVTTLVGDSVEALFVKGSGWDLDTIEPPGLPAVDLGHLRRLRVLAELSDEEMVNQLRTHLFDAGAPNPSVETLLHAFLPHRFIDHTHADIALVLTNQPRAEAEAMVREALGPRWGIVPYVMPGLALAKLAAQVYERDPSVEGLVLLNHGLFTFADDARTAYERMIGGVDRADHALVGGARIVGEREEAVVQQHQAFDLRVALEYLCCQLGEREARHDVGNDAPARTEGVAHHRLGIGARLIGEHERDVGVRVVDEAMRKKGVQQRLDRRIRRAGVVEMRAQLVDHLLVGKLGERA